LLSFTLINADTDQPITAFDPLNDGATLNLATLPTTNLNVRANTYPSTVGSVQFGYDGNPNYRVESVVPYALEGDSGGDYAAWTPSIGSHALTGTPYSGSGASGTPGTPLTINFDVINQTVNQPPSVSITSPTNNTVFLAPTDVTMTVNASDSDGSVTKVDFFEDGNLIDTDTTSPFEITWTSVPTGTHVLTATAVDNDSDSTTSAPVTIEVRVPGDFDQDGDIDQPDFGHLQECLTGAGIDQTDPDCQDAKLDGDSDVDIDDVAIFIGCISGPNQPVDENCVLP
jgi:hypothetical protein